MTARPSSRARAGVSLLFLTNGVLFATLLPRLPEVKDAFDLDAAGFGLMVAALPLGSIVAAWLPAPLIRRYGARAVTVVGTWVVAAALVVAVLTPGPLAFAGALLLAGFCDSVVDAAQNVQGMHVQRHVGRSIINSLHALWSAGAVLGGLVGAGFAAARTPLPLHLALVGAAASALVVVAARMSTVPERPTTPSPDGHGRRAAWGALLPLVLLAVAGTMLEDVANNWAALHLRDTFGLAAGAAGLGFVVFMAAQLIGRFAGDPLTDRYGVRRVAATGGVLIALGMAAASLAPHASVAFAGLAAAGLGCATLVPAAFAAADEVPGWGGGPGITVLGWLMRVGFLVSSPMIGLVADQTSLRVALVVPLLAGLAAVVVAATRLPGVRPGHTSAVPPG